MARIVYITPRYPFPPAKGDQLRAYFQILHLSREHEVHLISLKEGSVSEIKHESFSGCESVSVFPISGFSSVKNVLAAIFTQMPFQVAYFFNKKTKQLIQKKIEQIQPDYVHCHLIRCAGYVLDIDGFSKSLDYMDAFSLGMGKRAKIETNFLKKWLMNLEASRLKNFEKKMEPFFDRFCIISDQDRQALNLNSQVSVVPNGVDRSVFFPGNVEKQFDLCFMGNIDYPPNAEAVRFLVEEIFPKLSFKRPAIKLLIAGANPPDFIRKYANSNISVIAHFDNISDAIAQSRIMISPLTISIGMANKIIQAMAMKVPNIASPNAGAALGAVNGKELFVCNSVDEYVTCVFELLDNETVYHQMTENGYSFVKENYSWELVNRKLEKVIIGES